MHASYGLFFDNHLAGLPAITNLLDGSDHVRTLVRTFPATLPAWNAPGRRLPEAAVGTFPTLKFLIDPGLETPYAHHVAAGIDQQLPGGLTLSANYVSVRGHKQLGTVDYNPIVPALGPGRRPEDVGGVAGTSASILQYTQFGQTWFDGLTVALSRRGGARVQLLVSYTLSKAEDNSTDYQSAFIPQQNGRGRNPADVNGLPVGFDPDSERGPSSQDQRHRLVASGSWLGPGDAAVRHRHRRPGRPFTVLAAPTSTATATAALSPDRARRDPASEASSLGRHSETMPAQAVVDVRVSRRFRLAGRVAVEPLVEAFNLFNRTNYIETNNVSSAFIWGPGAYPASPLPTYGRFTQAGPPRQVQVAVKVTF